LGFWRFLPAAVVLASGLPAADSAAHDADAAAIASAKATVLNLDQCLQMAMEKNRRRPRSRFEVAMAEAQHKQALAGYWPQVSLTFALRGF
jgi:outer membrane protein TolC